MNAESAPYRCRAKLSGADETQYQGGYIMFDFYKEFAELDDNDKIFGLSPLAFAFYMTLNSNR